jgi:hypothetical protein
VPAGRFNPVESIVNPSVSVLELFLLLPTTLEEKTVMLPPTVNGLVPVKAALAPPFTLPETLDEGMLSGGVAPSVSAAAVLVKYAYVATLVREGCSTQVVVTVTAELPAAGPFGANVKLTVPGVADTERDSARRALRLTLAGFEFNWAQEAGANPATRIKTPNAN